MTGLAVTNPVADFNGVEFTVTHNGVDHRFVLNREALEDIEYKPFDTPAALLQAFMLHRGLIGRVAARALAERQDTGRGDAPIRLDGLLL
jgi:hypothetical protein